MRSQILGAKKGIFAVPMYAKFTEGVVNSGY